ncbi:hypothetical protein BSZ35_18595 [Salinibacter sp. 10B]|uniref:hypothetical protein n=1 Tax=Salinibacter sp. 10B TaxID=1923971 RepID=UPI000CF4D42D|nr:hypothetical protein [Salinibacter sp. 10B]PQJ26934.1 hypothetical protein BSZ35_18595 [Salinibacter sp. 10B]
MLSTRLVSTFTLSISLLIGAGPGLASLLKRAGVESIQLTEIHEDLRSFEDRDRYDYVDDDFEYSVIGSEAFDDVFRRSALQAGRLYQLRETSSRYREGELSLETTEDTDFLGLMTMEAFQSLPTLVSETERLSTLIDNLNPRELGRLQQIRAVRGFNRARKNIQMVLDARGDIDDLLNDYKTLQADLETVEDEDEEAEESQ